MWVPNKEAIVAAGAIPALVKLLIVDRRGGHGVVGQCRLTQVDPGTTALGFSA